MLVPAGDAGGVRSQQLFATLDLDQRSLIASHRSHRHGRAWAGHPRLPRLRWPKDVGGRATRGHDSRGNAWVIINERWYWTVAESLDTAFAGRDSPPTGVRPATRS